MKLKSIHLINFQCFKDSDEIPIHEMTIFIGENDSGKTAILNAIDFFLNNKPVLSDMFYKLEDKPEKTCEIKLTFEVDQGKTKDIPQEYTIDNKITLKKIFTLDNQNRVEQEILLRKFVFEKKELNNVPELKAPQLKEIFEEFNLKYSGVNEAKEVLSGYIRDNFDDLDKKPEWYPIKWSEISEFLPLFEYYDSSSYGDPQKLVENTLSSVYRSFFYDYDDEGNEALKKDFVEKQDVIRKELNKKIENELKDKVKSIIGKVKNISGDFSIDFASGFRLSSLLVNYGSGNRSINTIGEGSKKRLFLAITEWDKEIRTKESHKRVLRGYDEPDASLHYGAQKEMFYTLKNLSENEDALVQPIICTHSLSMIDRASAKIINHIVHEGGISHIEYLEGEEDTEIKEFLDKVSEISGIKNSSIFFERCFLIVEGYTEYNTLPIIYKKSTGRSLAENGVVLINIKGNGSWKSFLKLLNKNKNNATILFLDNDTQANNTKNNLTKERLEQIGFSGDFLSNNVIFVGNREFEDIFSDEVICRCLNEFWPKNGDSTWMCDDIRVLRRSDKFSKALLDLVNKYKTDNNANYDYFRKPEFGKRIGEMITIDELENINKLSALLDKMGEIIA